MPDTIPALLLGAAERDPGGDWLRTDDGELGFAAAAAAVARLAERRRDAGVRRAAPSGGVAAARTAASGRCVSTHGSVR